MSISMFREIPYPDELQSCVHEGTAYINCDCRNKCQHCVHKETLNMCKHHSILSNRGKRCSSVCFEVASHNGVISKSMKLEPDKVHLAIISCPAEELERTDTHPGLRQLESPSSRLTERHFVHSNPAQTYACRQSKQYCVVCSSRPTQDQPAGSAKRHRTQFWCPNCEKALCPFPCFERYEP